MSTVVTTMGISLMLPRLMTGFLPFLVAILAPVISVVLVWSTRDLGEVVHPTGLDEALAVLNGCPIPLLIVDFNGKLRFANVECGDYGLPIGENPGPLLSSVLHPHDVQPFAKALEAMSRAPDTVEQIQVRLGFGEDSVPVVARMARLKDRNRVVICLMEPIELPASLGDESREYQLKMDAICHGIQGPLVGISGVAATLAASMGDDSLTPWVEQLQSSSGQLGQTVEDLRFLVDLRAQRTRMKRVPVRLTDLFDTLIAEAIRDHQWPAPFVPLVDNGVPDWVMVDQLCLKRVLGSMLHHSMLDSPYSEIAICASSDGFGEGTAKLVFSTYPTGENPAAVIRQGLSKTPSRSLDVAHQFAKWMKGDLKQYHRDGNSIFQFNVALRQGLPHGQLPEEGKLRGTRVILIDRLGTRRRSMLNRLERLGMQLEIVPDGSLALSTLRREVKGKTPVELVILFDDIDDNVEGQLAEMIRAVGPKPPSVLRILPFGWQEDVAGSGGSLGWQEGIGILREPVNQRELVLALENLLMSGSSIVHVAEFPNG